MAKTSSGLEENTAGLLCYLAFWITGLVFILIEKDNKYIRFHAIQSIIVFGILHVAIIILAAIPIIRILAYILGLIAFILWIVLMIKASQGEKYKLPWAGNLAEKNS